MARYATMDPILFSAPPAAKRRRTIKKVLVEVKFPLS
jgi:hypothetical protein